jgi:formate/nitrite transporter FocA (FNT family)
MVRSIIVVLSNIYSTSAGWGVLFLKAIPANAMVCMAVMLGLASRDSAGKIMALWFPVVMFVLCGFEHCVANSMHSISSTQINLTLL